MWTNFPAQSTFLPFSLLFPPYPITEHSVSLFKNPLPKKARVGCSTTTASKHLYYLGWNRSPAQVGCMRQVLRPGALGKPRGIRWRRRWEGGSGWGTHVNPWLIQVNVWQKPLQYCKVISLQLIKINVKKKYMETIIAKKKTEKRILSQERVRESKQRMLTWAQSSQNFAPPPPFPQVFFLEELAINLEHTSRVAPSGA